MEPAVLDGLGVLLLLLLLEGILAKVFCFWGHVSVGPDSQGQVREVAVEHVEEHVLRVHGSGELRHVDAFSGSSADALLCFLLYEHRAPGKR